MEPTTPLPVRAASAPAPAIAFDSDFDARWAAWVARGRAHDRRDKRTLAIWAAIVAAAAAITYVVLRS